MVSRVPEELRPALADVLARLVAGDAEGLKRDGIDPYRDTDLFLWVRDYGSDGARLVSQPSTVWDHPYTGVIPFADGSGWAVDLPLWTEDESPSDLTLSLFVHGTPPELRLEVISLRVQ